MLKPEKMLYGVAHSCYVSPKVSQISGYVLLVLLGIWEVNLLTIETAHDFKKFF